MSAKLTELTAEQTELMGVVRDEWLAHGLSTEPADRAMAEQGVRLAYEAVGLPAPRLMIWLGSPLAGAVAAVMWPNWFPRGQVHGQVHDQVSGQVRDQVQSSRWTGYVAGNLWAGYYAYLAYFQRVGLSGLDPINGQVMVARSAGWWWPMRDVCILTDRPTVINGERVGPNGWGSHRLHCADGPALAYRDGWTIHAWHGVRVPGDLIEQGWDVSQILAEPNQEIRRAAIERIGWDRFITDAALTQVGADVPDPGNPGQSLALYDVPSDLLGSAARLLLCTNGSTERDGTRRRYGLLVDAAITDPLAAAGSTYGLTAAQYATMQVRT